MTSRTVGAAIADAARLHGDRTAVVCGTERVTYAELAEAAARYARALAGLGISAGDPVGMLMPNCLDYLLLHHACAQLGAWPVHFNTRYRGDELAYVIEDSDVHWLFTSARDDSKALLEKTFPALAEWRFGATLAVDGAPLLRGVCRFHAEEPNGWLDQPTFLSLASDRDPPVNEDPEQIGLVMYTSGTTARPKACLLSHRALEATAHAMVQRWSIVGDDCVWDPLPLFHMSTMLPLAACRAAGATFVAEPAFDAARALATIRNHQATILFPSFPAITNDLLSHRDFDAAALSRVRIVNNVGPPDLLRRYQALLPHAAHVSAYGLTEAGGVVAFHDPTDTPEQRATTCGRPFEGVEVRVVDPESLEPLAPKERGELQIRGPTLFSGYYKDAAKTQATLVDGWLRTGDLGALSHDGHIRYLGRIKDMLKVGGENVAAIEIESLLATHRAVRIAQVIGAPDERLGEVPAAFIELEPGANVDAAEIAAHCLGKIASFKVPRWVAFVTEWPMSATKIQKHRLRERLADATYVGPSAANVVRR